MSLRKHTQKMIFWIFIASMVSFIEIPGQTPAQRSSPGTLSPDAVQNILKSVRAYVRILQASSLDFVCLEKVTENINDRKISWSPVTNEFIYDYQYIRNGKEAKEMRTLIGINGVDKNVKDADLMTTIFRYENVLFGPTTLLDERRKEFYQYGLAGEESVDGEKAVVLRAEPKSGAEDLYLPSGKIWVRLRDSGILKIEWSPTTLRHYGDIEERARILGAVPVVTMTTDFRYEKNGIRFPSRHVMTEAYKRALGTTFVRSETVVQYYDYKFFTVATQEQIKRTPAPEL